MNEIGKEAGSAMGQAVMSHPAVAATLTKVQVAMMVLAGAAALAAIYYALKLAG